jgi:hypothetical protein
MSIEFPPGGSAEWFDASDLWGPLSRFGCLVEPDDYLQLRRIGSAGAPQAAVGLQMFVTDDCDVVVDSAGNRGNAVSVVLSPASCRKLAAALLDAADEASGGFEHVMYDEFEEVDDDDA